MDTPLSEELIDLPPSAKLVFKTLEYADKPLTQQQLVAQSLLVPRTTRYALTRLKSADLVEEEINLADARQSIYHLSSDGKNPREEPPPG